MKPPQYKKLNSSAENDADKATILRIAFFIGGYISLLGVVIMLMLYLIQKFQP